MPSITLEKYISSSKSQKQSTNSGKKTSPKKQTKTSPELAQIAASKCDTTEMNQGILLSVSYDGEKRLAYASLYDPKTKQVFHWHASS